MKVASRASGEGRSVLPGWLGMAVLSAVIYGIVNDQSP